MHERRLYQLMDFLSEIQVTLSLETFKEIFKRSHPINLWGMFTECKGDMLKFWDRLDVKNKNIFAHYLQQETLHDLS